MKKIWVLTQSHNDYNQHGEYFVAVFGSKPDIKRLAEAMQMQNVSASSIMEAIALLSHIIEGGGRRGTEDVWYQLEEVDLL